MNKFIYALDGQSSGGGDPVLKAGLTSNPNFFHTKGMQDDRVDVGDILSGFVGRGDKNLQSDQAQKDYHYLIGKLGAPMAQKLVTHVLTFNQRPDVQKQPFAEKLGSLYDIGSNDKDVNKILQTTKNLGAGPMAMAGSSPNIDTMKAMNKPNVTDVLSSGAPLAMNTGMIRGLGGK